jgi:hypothetical protein
MAGRHRRGFLPVGAWSAILRTGQVFPSDLGGDGWRADHAMTLMERLQALRELTKREERAHRDLEGEVSAAQRDQSFHRPSLTAAAVQAGGRWWWHRPHRCGPHRPGSRPRRGV